MRSIFQMGLIVGLMSLCATAVAGGGGENGGSMPSFDIGQLTQTTQTGWGCWKLSQKVTRCTSLTNCRPDFDLMQTVCDLIVIDKRVEY